MLGFKKSILTAGIIIALPIVAQSAPAPDKFVLEYRKQNKWVGKQEREALGNLLDTAKQKKADHFYFYLPAEKRELSLQRLIILRDILEKSLKDGVILEEINGDSPENTITVQIGNKDA